MMNPGVVNLEGIVSLPPDSSDFESSGSLLPPLMTLELSPFPSKLSDFRSILKARPFLHRLLLLRPDCSPEQGVSVPPFDLTS